MVYDFLTDDENKPLWLTNFVRQERIKGADGKVGSISRQFFRESGRQFALMEEITSAREGELYEHTLRHEQVDIRQRSELRAKGDRRTELKITFEYAPKTWLAHLLFWATRGKLQQRHKKDVQNLKSAVETLGD